MGYKKAIAGTLLYAGLLIGPLAVTSMGTERFDGYSLRRGSRTEIAPIGLDACNRMLIDNNGDGIPDRKYGIVAGRVGRFIYDLPVTESDREIFLDVLSKSRENRLK
ncbi:MAG TPA: hypothetical protein VJH04_00375 [archaeon]|nr:hypothetical protein [archaeon]